MFTGQEYLPRECTETRSRGLSALTMNVNEASSCLVNCAGLCYVVPHPVSLRQYGTYVLLRRASPWSRRQHGTGTPAVQTLVETIFCCSTLKVRSGFATCLVLATSSFELQKQSLALVKYFADDPRNEVWLLSGLPVEGMQDKITTTVPGVNS